MDIEKAIDDLRKYDEAYYRGTPIIPDNQYDMLRKQAEDAFPDHEYFTTSPHAKNTALEKVDLPYPMGSLNQVYENEALKWVDKHSCNNSKMVITEKLDGASILLIYEKSGGESAVLTRAFTRGDGLTGHNVTRHMTQIPGFPKEVSCDYLAVRAEVIMSNAVFTTKYGSKYKNPRNLVAGFLNRKETDVKMAKDISVVGYEIIDIAGVDDVLTKEETIQQLKKMDFHVARSLSFMGHELTDKRLGETLEDFRKTGRYELDGVVVTINDYSDYERASTSSSLNPEHSVKFKVQTLFADVTVEEVLWKLSKSNFFKPRIRFSPVDLDGATITYATGHNARFIFDKGIGKGAKIRVTRAGSVIPYVVDVVSNVEPDMPPSGTWEWDENLVEIVSNEEVSSQRTLMEVVHFFKTLGVEHVQETSIQKIIEYHGLHNLTFSDLVASIVYLWDEEWKRAIGENGRKAFISLHSTLSSLKPELLMGAVPFFGRGFGVRKSKKVLDQMEFKDFRNASLDDIQKLEGFDKTSDAIYSGIESFNDFIDRLGDYIEFSERSASDQTMVGQTIVMTGFRDKELKEKIEERGGKVTSSVSKNTTLVLAKNVKSSSSKLKKARELGIEIVAVSDFVIPS